MPDGKGKHGQPDEFVRPLGVAVPSSSPSQTDNEMSGVGKRSTGHHRSRQGGGQKTGFLRWDQKVKQSGTDKPIAGLRSQTAFPAVIGLGGNKLK